MIETPRNANIRNAMNAAHEERAIAMRNMWKAVFGRRYHRN